MTIFNETILHSDSVHVLFVVKCLPRLKFTFRRAYYYFTLFEIAKTNSERRVFVRLYDFARDSCYPEQYNYIILRIRYARERQYVLAGAWGGGVQCKFHLNVKQ